MVLVEIMLSVKWMLIHLLRPWQGTATTNTIAITTTTTITTNTLSLEILFFSQITFRQFWSLCCWMLRFGCSSYAWKRGVTLFTFCCLHYHNAIITIQFTLAFPDLCFNRGLIQATKRACLSSQQKSQDDSCLLRSLLVYSWSKNWTTAKAHTVFLRSLVGWILLQQPPDLPHLFLWP